MRLKKEQILFYLIIIVELSIIFMIIFRYFNSNNNFIKYPDVLTSQVQNPEVELPKLWENLLMPSKNEILMHELEPNKSVKFDGFFVKLDRVTTIKINSDGFRDRNYSIEKSNNTFRIVVLGDSFTLGEGVEFNETYSKILEKRLDSLNNEIKYEVLNFGVSGYNTLQEIEFFKVRGIKYNPDMIIIGYFHNDVENNTRMHEIKTEIVNRLNEKNFEDLETQVYITKESIKILQQEMKNKEFNELWKIVEYPLNNLYNITKQKNISVIIVTVGITDSTPREHINKLQEIVKKQNNWYFLDTYNNLSLYPKELLTNHKFDHHPSPLAHKIIADELFQYVVKNKLVPLSSEQFKFYNN